MLALTPFPQKGRTFRNYCLFFIPIGLYIINFLYICYITYKKIKIQGTYEVRND